MLLDVRDIDEWIGDSSSPYGRDFAPRKGRIPGAKWLEWYRFMKPLGSGPMIKSPDEVRAEAATAGIDTSDTVDLYRFKGARASNKFLALNRRPTRSRRSWKIIPETCAERSCSSAAALRCARSATMLTIMSCVIPR